MKKLAIVGAEPRTRDNAPWHDENYDIWVVNEWATDGWVKRYTATVDIHWAMMYTDGKYDRNGEYWNWLQQKRDKPVFMQSVDPDIPDSVKFPIEEANELYDNLTFMGRSVKNFRTSVSYCVALAILQGYEQIDTYGIEMTNNEYKGQVSNFAFWVGLAVGRGVKVNLHSSRGTFDGPLYGYEAIIEDSKAERYIIGLVAQLEEEKRKVSMIEGAIEICKQMVDEERKGDSVDVSGE